MRGTNAWNECEGRMHHPALCARSTRAQQLIARLHYNAFLCLVACLSLHLCLAAYHVLSVLAPSHLHQSCRHLHSALFSVALTHYASLSLCLTPNLCPNPG